MAEDANGRVRIHSTGLRTFGLHLNPMQAVVFCVDEGAAVQAPDGKDGMSPPSHDAPTVMVSTAGATALESVCVEWCHRRCIVRHCPSHTSVQLVDVRSHTGGRSRGNPSARSGPASPT
ncbi:hypothetical protein BN2475_750013 [Paraburkholderia ribeironis]|uniref:Uncharacterized protein n=1 Tax=Paraburkholderia ribeironis TaxID=1247936 RepID=A0A1N7SJC5_9BURK|nr:hypothetical protein BN2475_750013 [Paraburkholderia ribeironis]